MIDYFAQNLVRPIIDIDFSVYFACKQDRAIRDSSRHNYCLVDGNGRVAAQCNYVAMEVTLGKN